MKRGIFKIQSSEMTVGVMAVRSQRAAAQVQRGYSTQMDQGIGLWHKVCLCTVLVITIHQQALFSYEHNEKIQKCESKEKKLGHQLINPENLG